TIQQANQNDRRMALPQREQRNSNPLILGGGSSLSINRIAETRCEVPVAGAPLPSEGVLMLRTLSSADLLLRRSRGVILLLAILLTTALWTIRLPAEPNPPPAAAPERLRPAGIYGALVLCGGDKVPEAARQRFVELAGGPKAHLVVVPIHGQATDRAKADDLQ